MPAHSLLATAPRPDRDIRTLARERFALKSENSFENRLASLRLVYMAAIDEPACRAGDPTADLADGAHLRPHRHCPDRGSVVKKEKAPEFSRDFSKVGNATAQTMAASDEDLNKMGMAELAVNFSL